MKTYFRINGNGKVNIEHKLFKNPIASEKFAELSVPVEFDNFLSLIKDEKVKEKIIKEHERIMELNHLGRIGTKIEDGEIKGFYLGQLYFKRYFESIKAKDFAINYGYRYYGKEFMDDLMETGIFSGNQDVIKYFLRNKEISEEEYMDLSKERDELKAIRDLANPLDKSESCLKQKRQAKR